MFSRRSANDAVRELVCGALAALVRTEAGARARQRREPLGRSEATRGAGNLRVGLTEPGGQ